MASSARWCLHIRTPFSNRPKPGNNEGSNDSSVHRSSHAKMPCKQDESVMEIRSSRTDTCRNQIPYACGSFELFVSRFVFSSSSVEGSFRSFGGLRVRGSSPSAFLNLERPKKLKGFLTDQGEKKVGTRRNKAFDARQGIKLMPFCTRAFSYQLETQNSRAEGAGVNFGSALCPSLERYRVIP